MLQARLEYLAPPVDVWSLGVVLFAMLAGHLPFHAKDKKALSERIVAGGYRAPAWFTPAACDLVARMLEIDPGKRITLEEVWAHRWVADAPRWEPPGDGAGGLARAPVDPSTGVTLLDEKLLAALGEGGEEVAALRRALHARECSHLTAGYHLLREAQAAARAPAPESMLPASGVSDDGSPSGSGSSRRGSSVSSGSASGSGSSSRTMLMR